MRSNQLVQGNFQRQTASSQDRHVSSTSSGRYATPQGVSTSCFSRNNLVADQTVRKKYCETGSYFGVVPEKLANGRLLWPDVIVTRSGAKAVNDDCSKRNEGV